GWAAGAATSAPVKVALMKSTTTASTTTPAITTRQRAVLNVSVGLVDYGVDLGTVQVLDGKKVIAKVALKTNSDGNLVIRLKKLKRGKHKLSVVYLGNAFSQASKAKPVKIVVTKK
ncbi:MAG TPA: Ig-like domain-containing protein, partial [Nocardioides sp.]|nr:Ig-like domain-containing protein [Nocardioides sp.]